MEALLVIMISAGALLCVLVGIGTKMGKRQDKILEQEMRKKNEQRRAS